MMGGYYGIFAFWKQKQNIVFVKLVFDFMAEFVLDAQIMMLKIGVTMSKLTWNTPWSVNGKYVNGFKIVWKYSKN